MNPVFGRVLVELQQGVEVVDDLGDGVGGFGVVVVLERFDRELGPVDVFGVVDLLDRPPNPGRRLQTAANLCS